MYYSKREGGETNASMYKPPGIREGGGTTVYMYKSQGGGERRGAW